MENRGPLHMPDNGINNLGGVKLEQSKKEPVGQIRGVIFDMDGLMIDSEPLHRVAFDSVFKRFGKILTEEDNAARYVGISDLDAARDMITRYNIPLSPEDLVKEKQLAYRALLGDRISERAQPGLVDLLKTLKENGYRIAIASGSAREEIEAVINGLNIGEYIDTYVSAEDEEVKRGKPHPDIFTQAAKKLGFKNRQCLVLEDAESGINAATKAQMLRYAIPSRETRHTASFVNATRQLMSLSDVWYFLQIDSLALMNKGNASTK